MPVRESSIQRAIHLETASEGQGLVDAITSVSANIAAIGKVAEIDLVELKSDVATIESAVGTVRDSEDNALLSEQKAENWAEKGEDLEVELGRFSAKHHALKADSSRIAAENAKASVEGIEVSLNGSLTQIDANTEELASRNIFTDEEKAQLGTILETVANSTSASAYISSNGEHPLGIAETVVGLGVVTQSTDLDVFEVDGAADTVIFRQPGTYNFATTLNMSSTTNQDVLITFRLTDQTDAELVNQANIVSIDNGDSAVISLNTLIAISDENLPRVVKVFGSADKIGMTLVGFTGVVSGGVNNHNAILGRDNADSHPIAAITGLQTALDTKATKLQTSSTDTQYTDASTALGYKMYIDNGEVVMEEL